MISSPIAVFVYSFLFPFIISYYFYNFLNPKYKFKTAIISIFSLMIMLILSCVFYYDYLFKQILSIICYLGIVFLLFDNTVKEKFIALAIFFSVTYIFELIMAIVTMQLLNLDMNNLADIRVGIVYFIYYISLFLFYRIIIPFKQKLFSMLKYRNIIIIIILICIQYCYYIYLAFSTIMTREKNINSIYIMLFLFIILNIIFIFFMLQMIKEAKAEYTMYLLEQEYQKELEHFLSIKEQDDEIKMLRHDIINFLKKSNQIDVD